MRVGEASRRVRSAERCWNGITSGANEREGASGGASEGPREACEVDRHLSGQTAHRTSPPLAEPESAALRRCSFSGKIGRVSKLSSRDRLALLFCRACARARAPVSACTYVCVCVCIFILCVCVCVLRAHLQLAGRLHVVVVRQDVDHQPLGVPGLQRWPRLHHAGLHPHLQQRVATPGPVPHLPVT